MPKSKLVQVLSFFKKTILFIIFHILILLFILYIFILVMNISGGVGRSIYPNIFLETYYELSDLEGGRVLLFFGGIAYLFGFTIYEAITDSYTYFSTRKFIYIIKALIALLIGISSIVYLLWMLRII